MPPSKTSSRKKGREKKEEPPLRGPDGRFVKTTYVVIDEFGSASPYSRKEKTFGYAASVTEDKAGMERLAKCRRLCNEGISPQSPVLEDEDTQNTPA